MTLKTYRDAEGRLLRATLTPANADARFLYAPSCSSDLKSTPLLTVRNGTGFEPALDLKQDGGFVWTLRHGVTIKFNTDGLVEAIGSPYGERVTYLRQAGWLVGQQTSDDRHIDVQYSGPRPEAITVQGERRAAYQYHADYWLVQVRGNRQAWSIGYDPNGRPNQIASALGTLSLEHDAKGWLTSVQSSSTAVQIEYLAGTNTLRFSGGGKPAMEWLLGPISGAVMQDRTVLLTRSMAGPDASSVQGSGRGNRRRQTVHRPGDNRRSSLTSQRLCGQSLCRQIPNVCWLGWL